MIIFLLFVLLYFVLSMFLRMIVDFKVYVKMWEVCVVVIVEEKREVWMRVSLWLRIINLRDVLLLLMFVVEKVSGLVNVELNVFLFFKLLSNGVVRVVV